MSPAPVLPGRHAAVTTRYPALRNFSETTCRMCDSSSATRMVLVVVSTESAPLFAKVQLKAERASFSNLAVQEDPSLVHCFDNVLHQ